MKILNVRSKLILACLAILLVFSVSSGVSFFLNNEVMQKYQYFYEHPYQDVNLIRAIQTELLSVRIGIKDLILTGNTAKTDSAISNFKSSEAKLASDIGQLKSSSVSNPSDIDKFQNEFNQWWALGIQVLDLVRSDKAAEAAEISINKATGYSNDMINTLNHIILSANDFAGDSYAKAKAAHESSERISLVCLALSIFISAAIILLLTRDITRPIKAMMETIERVEGGLAVTDIEVGRRGDELGKVASAFNQMLVYLRTQRELNELKLKLEHQNTLEQFRITLMSIGDAVISTDTSGNVASMNPVAEKMTGWPMNAARGMPVDGVFNIVNAKTGQRADNPLSKVLKSGSVIGLANHTVLISRTGERYHIADSAAPIKDDSGRLLGVVLVFRDVSEDYRKQEEIISMSFHDKLTGLFNRAYLEEEIVRLNAARQMPLSLIMGDINGLKLINDTFGHQEGDKYLISAANAIKSCCRSEDIIARWGGDEFVILLPKTTEQESQGICDRIVTKYSAIAGFAITPSIAIGCAVQQTVQRDYQKLLKDAETNMYRHKLLESGSFRSSVVASLDNSLLERDFGTEEHAQAMVRICADVGRQLGLNASMQDELELLARLHDIGKIAISDSILAKAGPLNPEEWEVMRRHPEIGFRIAKSVPDLEHVAEGILSHHERWDGMGYPRGLSGEEIPFTSRIVAVVDAYDAMTRGRPYKEAITAQAAGRELGRCSGTQFDPAVVDAFLKSIQEHKGDVHARYSGLQT